MTTFLADFLGKLSGIFCVSVFLNFLFRKMRSVDSNKQKYLSIFLATLLYIIIPTWVTRTTENLNELIAWAIISVFCGIIVVVFHIYKIELRYFLLSEIYGILIFVAAGLPIIFVLNIMQVYSTPIGTTLFMSSLIISSILVFNHKLPGVKKKILI